MMKNMSFLNFWKNIPSVRLVKDEVYEVEGYESGEKSCKKREDVIQFQCFPEEQCPYDENNHSVKK